MSSKALILGTNYYIGLSAIRGLGMEGIHTVAVDYSKENTYGAKSKYCKEHLIAPHYKRNPKGFVSFLIDYAKKQSHPPVLIPCHDSYVEVIDNNLTELRKYFLIHDIEQGLLTKLMDKGTLHQVAKSKSVLVPETIRPDQADYLKEVETKIKYPCLVKPVDSPAFVSEFRRKLFKVSDEIELKEAIQKADAANLEVIIQRMIPGFDDHMYTFDAYLNDESKVTHATTCQKHRQYPINFGASVYTEQKYVHEIYEIGKELLEGLNYKGFAEIEFKKDSETGQFYLIEINVRITNFNALLHKLGLNMPYITYRNLIGDPVETRIINESTGKTFWYAYEDLLAIRDYMKSGQLSFRQVVASFNKRKVYAIWHWRDPKPGIMFTKMLLQRVFKKLFRSNKS